MSNQTSWVLKALYILTWIIFVGLGIEAGGFLTNMIATLIIKPEGAARFWKEIDLSALYRYNVSHFITLASILLIATILKAILFYQIIRIFHARKITADRPFTSALEQLVSLVGYIALGIGFFSLWGMRLTLGFEKEGVAMPDTALLRLGGGDVWLFMGVVLLVIGTVLKKGVELQNENDLTV